MGGVAFCFSELGETRLLDAVCVWICSSLRLFVIFCALDVLVENFRKK